MWQSWGGKQTAKASLENFMNISKISGFSNAHVTALGRWPLRVGEGSQLWFRANLCSCLHDHHLRIIIIMIVMTTIFILIINITSFSLFESQHSSSSSLIISPSSSISSSTNHRSSSYNIIWPSFNCSRTHTACSCHWQIREREGVSTTSPSVPQSCGAWNNDHIIVMISDERFVDLFRYTHSQIP